MSKNKSSETTRLSPEITGKRVGNKNIYSGARHMKVILTKSISLGNEECNSSEHMIGEDCVSTATLGHLPIKTYRVIEITRLIKILLALFADCPMYFRTYDTLEVFLLPELPAQIKSMKYKGLFKNQIFYESIRSSEFVVWGCSEDTFSIAQKSDDKDNFFTRLLQNIKRCSCRNVQYEEIMGSFVKQPVDAPIISLSIDTVWPLGKQSYALSSTLNVPREILVNKNAAMAPSGADVSSANPYETTCAHAASVNNVNVSGTEQTYFPFHKTSQSRQAIPKIYIVPSGSRAIAGGSYSSNSLTAPRSCSSETTETNNVSSFASAKDVDSIESQDTMPSRPGAKTPVARHRQPARYHRYITEPSRLQSFSTWPHEHPTAEKCVIAGFFYTGEYDLIRCFQCGIGLKDFSPNDDPMAEHIRNSETCLYLVAMFGPEGFKTQRKELERSNIENNRLRQYNECKRNHGAASSTHTPSSPQYSTFESRLLTFESDNFRSTKNPEELAAAGLFYTDVGDEVRCFFCNGGLRNWEENDDPWTEHSKWYPACGFVREVKGDAFIEKVQQSANTPATMLNVPTNPSAAVNYQNDLDLDIDLVMTKTICMEEMGFTEEIFDEAVYHLKLDGYYHPNIEDIINRIDQIQKETNKTASHHNSEAFYEENQRLKRMVKCSKCITNDSNALFLPCAHHVMCIDCARDVKRCPLCNRGVNDVVKTFMG